LGRKEIPVNVCARVPPLVKATMLPSGKGRLKKLELGANDPNPPASVVHPGTGPLLKQAVDPVLHPLD